MAADSWPGIRPGAVRVDVYNEGLLVFLLDESHLATIEASGADLESGYAEEDADIDKPLKKLAKEGVLVAYELIQDDAVTAEVVVGPPLTKAELALARWHKPQIARLKLPSGVLRIDSANTLPLFDDPDEEPGRVSVPPGDYVLSLYRLHWDKLKEDGLLVDGEEWTGPQEVYVLTPVAETKPIKGAKPLLRFPSAGTAHWLGKYQIVDGVFHGKAFAAMERNGCLINIDRPAAKLLGLDVGAGLRVEVEGLTLEAVYIGEADPLFAKTKWVKTIRGDRREFGAIYRTLDDKNSAHYLFLDRVHHSRDFPFLNKWIPATATLLTERFTVPGAPAIATMDDDDIDLDDLEEAFAE